MLSTADQFSRFHSVVSGFEVLILVVTLLNFKSVGTYPAPTLWYCRKTMYNSTSANYGHWYKKKNIRKK